MLQKQVEMSGILKTRIKGIGIYRLLLLLLDIHKYVFLINYDLTSSRLEHKELMEGFSKPLEMVILILSELYDFKCFISFDIYWFLR